MLFKRRDQCLISTIPNNFYPVDGAFGVREIVDVLKRQDFLVRHFVLLDRGEVTKAKVATLGLPIRAECFSSNASSVSFRRVTQFAVSAEQAATLQAGGVVFLPQVLHRACSVKVLLC